MKHLLLTHLWPETDPEAAQGAAGETFHREIGIAAPGLVIDV